VKNNVGLPDTVVMVILVLLVAAIYLTGAWKNANCSRCVGGYTANNDVAGSCSPNASRGIPANKPGQVEKQ